MSVVTPELLHVYDGLDWRACHESGGQGWLSRNALKRALIGWVWRPVIVRQNSGTIYFTAWLDHWRGNYAVWGLRYWQQTVNPVVAGQTAYILPNTHFTRMRFTNDQGGPGILDAEYPSLPTGGGLRHRYWLGDTGTVGQLDLSNHNHDRTDYLGGSGGFAAEYKYDAAWASYFSTPQPFEVIGYATRSSSEPTGPDDMAGTVSTSGTYSLKDGKTEADLLR